MAATQLTSSTIGRQTYLINGAADDQRPRRLLHGHRLSGDEALVAEWATSETFTVDGDFSSGQHLEDVSTVNEVNLEVRGTVLVRSLN